MRSLGEILVEKRLLTPQQLDYALGVQRARYGLLGELLVELGFVNEDHVVEGLTEQLSATPRATARGSSIREATIAPEVLRLVPANLLVKHCAMPIRYHAETRELVVALVDGEDVTALDELRFASNCRVTPLAASREDIEFLWQKYLKLSGDKHKGQRLDLTGEFRAVTAAGPAESSIVKLVDGLVAKAIALGASDIHCDPFDQDVIIRFRIDGVLYHVLSLPRSLYTAFVSRLKVTAGMDIAEKRATQDGRVTLGGADSVIEMRLSVLPVYNGERVAIRLLNRSGLSFDINELGMTADDLSRFRRQLERPSGLVLVTGPTGSGKTTTLYSILSYLNDLSRSILTIEDPVEFSFPGLSQVQVDERTGFSFAEALRSVLRQDPNVIMVGEIRDEQTAQICARASLTGHLVLTTAHTNDAATAVARLISMGVPPFMVASCLNLSVAQRLVRRVCPRCRVQDEPDSRDLLRLGLRPKQLEALRFYRGRGCTECNFTGFRGRSAIFEMMAVSARMRDLIGKQASVAELRRQSRREKIASLAADGLSKAQQGLTTVGELMQHTYYDNA